MRESSNNETNINNFLFTMLPHHRSPSGRAGAADHSPTFECPLKTLSFLDQ